MQRCLEFVVDLDHCGRYVYSHSGTKEAIRHTDMTSLQLNVVVDSNVSKCMGAVANTITILALSCEAEIRSYNHVSRCSVGV